MKAIWNGATLAESNDTVVVEGNHYFPINSIQEGYFRKNDHHTTCPWKGIASYYDVVVDGKVNESAAWYYPNPAKRQGRLKDVLRFGRACGLCLKGFVVITAVTTEPQGRYKPLTI